MGPTPEKQEVGCDWIQVGGLKVRPDHKINEASAYFVQYTHDVVAVSKIGIWSWEFNVDPGCLRVSKENKIYHKDYPAGGAALNSPLDILFSHFLRRGYDSRLLFLRENN